MFRKLAKCFLSLTFIGGIIATIYYFYTSNQTTDEFVEDNISDTTDNFDLDSDLEPIGKREYVSLNRTSVSEDDATQLSESE